MTLRFKDETRSSYSYDAEKARLKGMEARRKQLMNGQAFVGTEDPSGPVALEGGWKARAAEEVQLQNKLRSSSRMARPQSSRPELTIASSDAVLRVLAIENGGNPDNAVYVWGSSVDELLRNATTRLGLRRPARRLFTVPTSRVEESHEVQDLKAVRRDQLVAVSTGLNYISEQAAKSVVFAKRDFANALRTRGPRATDMVVAASDLAAQRSTRSAIGRDNSPAHIEEVEDL